MRSELKTNFFAPINQTSYGIVSSYILRELIKVSDVRYIPIGSLQLDKTFSDLVPHIHDSWKFHKDSPCVKIWHQFDLANRVGKGPLIGFPIFELEQFSEREIMHIESCDYLAVPSKWAKSVVLDQTSLTEDKVFVVPLGVDNTVFTESPLPEGTTTFGNFGKWELRKGHDVLIEIFNKAFSPKDDVQLVMMPSNFFLSEQQSNDWMKFYKGSKLGDKIHFVGRLPTHQNVYSVMTQIDCGIFPNRGEGWNLEGLELLACGRHLITSNITGQTEYCNNKNSRLVPLTQKEKAFDGVFFHGENDWYKISSDEVDMFVEEMRTIHKLKSEGQLSINNEGIKTANHFTWSNSVSELTKVINASTT